MEEFFTNDFRDRLEEYINSTDVIDSLNKEKEDDKKLKSLFHELPSINKTMVLFIIEHILW
jgi:hypothetical protein